jgi:hypothetical protein
MSVPALRSFGSRSDGLSRYVRVEVVVDRLCSVLIQ